MAAFTWGFAAPAIFGDIALAQGGANRNLVVLYLSGGNDSLNTVIPYTDANYYARRPTIAVPAANVLQIGTAGTPVGLHPRMTGIKSIFDQGRCRDLQPHRLSESEPLALLRARRLVVGEHARIRRPRAGWDGISIRCRHPSIR